MSEEEEKVKQKPITTEDRRTGELPVNKEDLEYLADETLEEIERGEGTKIMILCANEHPAERTYRLLQELSATIPNMKFFKRKTFPLKKISMFAAKKGFTHMIVVQEKGDNPDSMFISSLPEGPTAYYKISGLKLGCEMKHTVPCNAEHKPEILATNFKTRLGLRVAKHLESLFPNVGDDIGRRSVVFHNQRDFIFFRHYRYIFRNVTIAGEEEEVKPTTGLPDDFDISEDEEMTGPKPPSCQLKEIGPRFTLRLRSLQLTGMFDKKTAEFEYMWRPDANVSRAFCEL
jgi:ribosome production factor 1